MLPTYNLEELKKVSSSRLLQHISNMFLYRFFLIKNNFSQLHFHSLYLILDHISLEGSPEEYDLIDDILFCLQGYPGKYITPNNLNTPITFNLHESIGM